MSEQQILCYGDSNTWGHIPVTAERHERNVRWPGVMAGELGSGFHVVEEGLCGRTTVWDDPIEGDKNGLAYLPACLASHKPLDLIILMLGTNDLKTRFSVSALDIALSVERLIQVIQTAACGKGGQPPAVLLAAPPPVILQGETEELLVGGDLKSARFAEYYAAVAQRCGCAFLDVGQFIGVDPADGIHYSADAHHALGLAMADAVRSIMQKEC